MSWKDMEMRAFQMKEKKDPTSRPSTKTSLGSPVWENGERTVVSQYGGVASAAACS